MMKIFKKIFGFEFSQKTRLPAFNIEYASGTKFESVKNDFLQNQYNLLKIFTISYLKKLSKAEGVFGSEKEIIHYAFFKNIRDRENFSKNVIEYEFIPIEKFLIKDEKNYNFGIKFIRIDKLDKHSINEFTELLWNSALKNNGIYKNWEIIPINEADKLFE